MHHSSFPSTVAHGEGVPDGVSAVAGHDGADVEPLVGVDDGFLQKCHTNVHEGRSAVKDLCSYARLQSQFSLNAAAKDQFSILSKSVFTWQIRMAGYHERRIGGGRVQTMDIEVTSQPRQPPYHPQGPKNMDKLDPSRSLE